jgi:hypothetical protein
MDYTGRNAITHVPKYRVRTSMFDVRSKLFLNRKLEIDVIWALAGEWIQKLCIDFMNPHFFLCRKSPIQTGRSAEWIKAREHYVLIHKTHPANRAGAVGVFQKTDSSCTRSAHSRRAHYRLLRSPKFKNKVGQKVWVKSTWVGPREWSDSSNQIYRIIEKCS